MRQTRANQTNSPIISLNPFVVESPEKLTPKQIEELFIEEYTDIEILKQRKHTFIWGSRGSGKSMMLRYLEPQCQSIVHNGVDNIFKDGQAFLAIYFPCKEGQFNKTELELLDVNAALILTEHMMNLSIADRVIACLRKQFPEGFFGKDNCERFAEIVRRLFDPTSIASSAREVGEEVNFIDDPLNWLQALFITEFRKVSTFLRRISLPTSEEIIYEGATSGYHDFLLPFIKAVQNLFPLNSLPIYIMVDDADRLTRARQTIVNTWVANRDQATLCLKISAQHDGYETFVTRDGGLIEQPHDYSVIDIDELYTKSTSKHAEKLQRIAERRLELSNIRTKSIEEFLHPDETEEALLEKIKKETAEEWKKVEKPGEQSDYVHRYAMPRLFQLLGKKKKRKSYAGFQNMIHISSGVVRDFLEPCYLMFDEYVSRGYEPHSIEFIPPAIQNEVLFNYSESFLLLKFDELRRDHPPDKRTQIESLSTLLESLGRLFYARLHDPEAREARLFSFTVRGRIQEDVEEILRIGVKHRYFQLRTYSTKEGGGREKWYILNRRLCPVYTLDSTGFGGRISLTPDVLRLGCEDPDKFVRLRLRLELEEDPQQQLFTLEME